MGEYLQYLFKKAENYPWTGEWGGVTIWGLINTPLDTFAGNLCLVNFVLLFSVFSNLDTFSFDVRNYFIMCFEIL